MSPERWRRINDLFHAAVELPPAERDLFLNSECAGDAERLVQLQAMLEGDKSSRLLDQSPWSAFSSAVAARRESGTAPAPVSDPAFLPDQLLAGRYRIVRFLNRGGMGEVYEVEDLEFHDRVALKTLLPSIAGDAAMVARFKQEIQLSRKIGHPNVCRVFDLSRDPLDPPPGIPVTYFLTMQLLAGETLAARLQREGPLPPAVALPMLEQMAAGLDAAHSAGVIHRDFKPSNVMLVPGSGGDRAIVTDFGLARSFTGGVNTASHTANVMGTLDYMAPELFSGRPASVASDVYALGVVAQRMLGESVSGPLATPIESALHRDPARRPVSAGSFVAAIRGEAAATGSITIRVPGSRTRNALLLAGLVLALMSLSFWVFRYPHQGAGIDPGSLVYLMDPNNATQDPELAATREVLRNHLRQSAHIRLLDDAQISRARSLVQESARSSDPALTAREVALRAGAALVVFTTLSRVADRYDLAVAVQRVGATPAVVSKEWRHAWQARSKPEIFTAIQDAGDWVRSVSGEAPAELAEHDVPPADAASSSWEALSLYQQAEALKTKREIEAAIALLYRALAVDPDFALAHVRLADYLTGQRRQEEAFRHYEQAIEAAGKRRLTRWEELNVRGIQALDLGNFVTAEGAFRELNSLYPRDPLPLHHLAAAVRYQGRLEQSSELEVQSLRLSPDSIPAITSALQDYLLLGRLDDAEAMARRLNDAGLAVVSTEYQGVVQYQRGNAAAAQACFEKEMTDRSALRRSRATSLLAALHAEAGAYQRAMTMYQDGLSADLAAGLPEQAAQKHLALAFLYMRRKETAAARTHSLEAVHRLRSLNVSRRAASVLARSGYPADANAILADLAKWPGPLAATARSYVLGEILLAQADAAGALREFEAADRGDPAWRPRDYLARVYARAGDGDRALFLYQSMTRSWAPFWLYADSEFPAQRTGLLLEAASLAARLQQPAAAETILREHMRLRPDPDPELPETIAASKLAANLNIALPPERTKR